MPGDDCVDVPRRRHLDGWVGDRPETGGVRLLLYLREESKPAGREQFSCSGGPDLTSSPPKGRGLPRPHRTALGWEFQVRGGGGPCRESSPPRSGLHWPCQVAVSPILGTTVRVVSSGLPTFVGGFGGTCVATGTDVSRRGIVEIQSDASEFVRLSRHGRGWTASDGYRNVPLAPKPVESGVWNR